MAFPHAVPGEARSVLPLGQALPTQQTHALFKSTDLEVLRLVLQAGQSLPDHTVRGEITIQCIEGELLIRVEGEPHILKAGSLLFLAGGQSHGVQAKEASSALVTIALK